MTTMERLEYWWKKSQNDTPSIPQTSNQRKNLHVIESHNLERRTCG
jgi:hypothetical protein